MFVCLFAGWLIVGLVGCVFVCLFVGLLFVCFLFVRRFVGVLLYFCMAFNGRIIYLWDVHLSLFLLLSDHSSPLPIDLCSSISLSMMCFVVFCVCLCLFLQLFFFLAVPLTLMTFIC